MRFIKVLLGVALMAFMLMPKSAEAEHIYKDSFLCKSKNLFYTMVGFSTKDFDIALCKDDGDDGTWFYIGQDKKTKATMFLPTIQEDDANFREKGYSVNKARNGEYTYQVAIFFTPPDPYSITHVSLSVFKNGKKIYHAVSKTILVGIYGDI